MTMLACFLLSKHSVMLVSSKTDFKLVFVICLVIFIYLGLCISFSECWQVNIMEYTNTFCEHSALTRTFCVRCRVLTRLSGGCIQHRMWIYELFMQSKVFNNYSEMLLKTTVQI